MSSESKNLGPLLIILVVLIVALGANYARTGEWPNFLLKLGLGGEKLELIERAEEGEVVSNFPLEFLSVATDSKVAESGLYRGEDGQEVLVTEYTTGASASDLFAAYINFLTDRGYEVLGADAKRGVTLISAQSGPRLVDVRIESKGLSGNEVRISVRERVLE